MGMMIDTRGEAQASRRLGAGDRRHGIAMRFACCSSLKKLDLRSGSQLPGSLQACPVLANGLRFIMASLNVID